jgi:hypothetical protein
MKSQAEELQELKKTTKVWETIEGKWAKANCFITNNHRKLWVVMWKH